MIELSAQELAGGTVCRLPGCLELADPAAVAARSSRLKNLCHDHYLEERERLQEHGRWLSAARQDADRRRRAENAELEGRLKELAYAARSVTPAARTVATKARAYRRSRRELELAVIELEGTLKRVREAATNALRAQT